MNAGEALVRQGECEGDLAVEVVGRKESKCVERREYATKGV